MSILNAENLTHGFEDKVLFNKISFRLLRGEHVGLVGNNGVGKSTLFNLLNGKLIPDDGIIEWSNSIKVGYLDQFSIMDEESSIRDILKGAFNELYHMEEKMLKLSDSLANESEEGKFDKILKKIGDIQDLLSASNFYSIESLIDNVAGGLGLRALGMETPVKNLSGGQRTKVKLAKLLLSEPDVLLLDEPTNYLDKEHVEWLTDYLKNYKNSFIVISHDTAFLNNVVNVIYHLQFTKLNRYIGNYDKFTKLYAEEKKRYIENYNRQQAEIKKTEEFIKKNIVRASTTKRAQSRMKALDKIERLEKPRSVAKPNFKFMEAREPGKLILRCHDLSIGYNYPLIENLNFEIRRGDKIALTGCNGIGKSTFMKTIMSIIPCFSGSVEYGEYIYPLYFEQEVKSESSITVVEDVWNDFPKMTRKEIMEALARCGLKEEHFFEELRKLSGGEAAKVRMCKLMMIPGNFLLLDEPTNHLDVIAKDALKECLIKFNGTVLLVSHEAEFYDGVATKVWNMEKLVRK